MLGETQRALEESRRRYVDLYDFAPVAYLTLDSAARIKEANLTAARLLGLPRLRLVEASFMQFVAPQDVDRFAEHLHRCFEHRVQAVTEIRISVGRTIPPLYMHVSSTPLFDDAEKVVECRMTLTDVSSVKRNEERQSLLSDASRLLVTALDDELALAGILGLTVGRFADLALLDLVRDDGTLYRVDQAAALADVVLPDPGAATPPGLPQQKAVASHQTLFVPDCSPKRLSEIVGRELQELVAGNGVSSAMVVPLISRGIALGVLTLVAARRLRKFSPADVATAEDLAARLAVRLDNARLYRQAREAVAAREEILSLVAHDLRNPLSAIRLSAMSITSTSPAVERRKAWPRIERVRRIADHMNRMIEDLADFTALDSRPFALDIGAREVPQLLNEVVDALMPLATDKGIELHLEAAPPGEHVLCDPDRVLQVFSNVIGNAVKFSQPGGTIALGSAAKDGTVLFTVRDDGPGMAPAELEHIFDKYWQAHDGGRHGRGLGLYIAKRLIEAQGGAIWCSSAPEKGTMVSFTLPRPAAP
jgi:PAS domain S-box-containing protein